MTLERAAVRPVPKPWGRADLHPFATIGAGECVGELWFTRPHGSPRTSLLIKLLFTSAPLSIQVHPTDAYATSMGLPNGKSEAWVVLDATPDASVALGLRQSMTPTALRTAIDDGSILDLVAWHPAAIGDVFAVPAGTIHAIGAGLVLAEVQQNSDTTFRLFDFGRDRALQVDAALATADLGPAVLTPAATALSETRSLLVAMSGFVIERVVLPRLSTWILDAATETWLLPLAGDCVVASMPLMPGAAVFLLAQQSQLTVGSDGMVGLLAYQADAPLRAILCDSHRPSTMSPAPFEAGDRASSHGTGPIARTTPSKAIP